MINTYGQKAIMCICTFFEAIISWPVIYRLFKNIRGLELSQFFF